MKILQKNGSTENFESNAFMIIIFVFLFVMIFNSKSNIPKDIEEEIKQKTPWLKQTTDDIVKFMDEEDADVFITVRSRSFRSYFATKNYDKEKFLKLSQLLKNRGWQQINLQQFHKLENPNLAYTSNYPIDKETIILCQNGATTLIWTDNIIGKYNDKDSATFVYLDFDYLSPCYKYG